MGFFIATLAEVDLFRISEHRLTALENYREEDGEEVQAQMTLLETEKNKAGSGNLIKVVENYKTSKVNAFQEDEVFGEKNADGEVSSNRRLQRFKTLGALTIQKR